MIAAAAHAATTAGAALPDAYVSGGSASVALAAQFTNDAAAPAAAGFAAVVGHIYPVWLRFRGGKGVATACGVFSVLTPLALPPALAIFAVAVWLTKYISLGSLLASVALPPLAYAFGGSLPAVAAACAASTIIVFRHRSNVGRLRTGTERRLGMRV